MQSSHLFTPLRQHIGPPDYSFEVAYCLLVNDTGHSEFHPEKIYTYNLLFVRYKLTLDLQIRLTYLGTVKYTCGKVIQLSSNNGITS